MRAQRYTEALRHAAETVDVPGAPLSLRIDHVALARAGVQVDWSFDHPSYPGDDIRGRTETEPQIEDNDDIGDIRDIGEIARSDWAQVQLEAASRFKTEVDADWVPGMPPATCVWEPEGAWQALVEHLGRYRGEVREMDGELHVRDGHDLVVYRITPAEWAAYLNSSSTEPTGDDLVVEAGVPLDAGLPLWASDELVELGAWLSPYEIVDGHLVGQDSEPDD